MGTSFSCEKCSPVAHNSVFTFSNELVLKVTEGKNPKILTQEQLDLLDDVGDAHIFQQLKCMDDQHSQAYGLTASQVNRLMDHLQQMINDVTVQGCMCSDGVIIKCFNTNKECPLNCNEKVKEYDKCIQETTWEKLQNEFNKDNRNCVKKRN